PKFEKAGVLTDLVPVLKAQHQAGRKLTDQVMNLAKTRSTEQRAKLADALRQFVRMYRPHEAREDTVLFPELRKIVSAHEFDALGEQFETLLSQSLVEGAADFVTQLVAGSATSFSASLPATWPQRRASSKAGCTTT